MIMSPLTIRYGLSRPSLMSWTSRRVGLLVVAEATRRPGYGPGDLLKLYIYGYLNRVRSSRRLEAETHRNPEVIWLLRHLKPDFKTIADFRRDNHAAFRSVFREFVLLCRQLDLFGRELLAVDGTRIKAVNNKNRDFTRASLRQYIDDADRRLADYLRRLDDGDLAESSTNSVSRVHNLMEKIAAVRAKRDRLDGILNELEQTGESQISLTDPDSRAMAGHTRVAVAYIVQLAVDAKHKLARRDPRRRHLARQAEKRADPTRLPARCAAFYAHARHRRARRAASGRSSRGDRLGTLYARGGARRGVNDPPAARGAVIALQAPGAARPCRKKPGD